MSGDNNRSGSLVTKDDQHCCMNKYLQKSSLNYITLCHQSFQIFMFRQYLVHRINCMTVYEEVCFILKSIVTKMI